MTQPRFQLFLFGPLRVVDAAGEAGLFRSDKVRGLLAYLVLEAHTQPVSRLFLQKLLWPGYTAASANGSLRTALSNLRAIFNSLDPIETTKGNLRFRVSSLDFWCDAVALMEDGADHQNLEDRNQENEQSFLYGIELDDCPDFMQWIHAKRAFFQKKRETDSSDRFSQPIGRWQNIPDSALFCGRETEMEMLGQWLGTEPCRLIGLFGMGGQGKTTLAAEFVRSLAQKPSLPDKRGSAPGFARILWSSLLNAPTWQNVLDEWVAELSGQPNLPIPDHLDGQLSLLMGLASQQPTLFVLDNLETIQESGELAGRFRPGYEAFGQFLERMAQTVHPSTVLITSREQPAHFGRWQQSHPGIHALFLGGLDEAAGGQLLGEHLASPLSEIAELVRHFSGNPLSLLLIGRTVSEIFGDDIPAFLRLDKTVFGDVQDVLAVQFTRLSRLEQQILFQLALAREAVAWPTLQSRLPPVHSPMELLDAVRSLQRRSLLEIHTGGVVGFSAAALANSRFGLQNVILEFVGQRLVEQVADEIESREMVLLSALALLAADTPHYIREMQQRLILQPIRERIVARQGEAAAGRKLRGLLDDLRGGAYEQVGAAAVNILHLLLGLGKAVEGSDFSRLPLPNAYLRGVKVPGVSLAHADLTGSAFTQLVGIVRDVAVHPDGRRIAACTRDGTIWLWQMPEQTVYPIAASHQNQVNEVAFSPDGSLLAYASVDGFVGLWDMQAHRLYGEITKGIGMALAFSPDGQVIAGCEGDAVWLWHIATGELLPLLPGNGAPLVALAFSPDGETLISTDRSGFVNLWEWRQARLVQSWRGAQTEILRVSVHPNGECIAAISDGDVIVWDMQGHPLFPRIKGESHFLRIAFSPTGEWLVGSGYDGNIYIWETQTGHCLRLLRGHTQGTNGLAFFSHGQWLATGSADQSVRIWDVDSGHQLHELTGYKHSITTLAITPDGDSLAHGGNSGEVHLWQLASGQVTKEWPAHQHRISTLAFHPGGRLLASASADRSVRLWDMENGRQVNVFWGHDWSVERVLFHPRRPLLVSASIDGQLCLWNIEAGHLISQTKAHTDWISDIAFSPDGTLLATAGGDQTIRLWSLAADSTLDKTEKIPVPNARPGYGPMVAFLGCQRLVFGTGDGIYIYDLPEHRIHSHQTGHGAWVMGLASSGDGALFASTGIEKSLRLWEGDSGHLRWAAELHFPVEALAFSPDGAQLYTGNLEGEIEVWDTANGALLRRVAAPGPYEGMNIRGMTGISEAQRASLLALGAVER